MTDLAVLEALAELLGTLPISVDSVVAEDQHAKLLSLQPSLLCSSELGESGQRSTRL